MKKSLIVFFSVSMLTLSAFAQVPTPFSLYAGGALSLPNSPDGFKDSFKTGYHGLVGLGYKMGPSFQLVGKVEYHNFGYDFASLSGVEGGNTRMWLFGGDGRFSLDLPAAPIKPFVFAGAGLANVKQSDFSGDLALISSLTPSYPESQNKLFYNLGGGVEFGGGPSFSIFAQFRYVSVSTEGDNTAFVPITVGLKFF
ncbi:MAG: outer membrane beta-barrel protein [Candidatus Zixiibacteriota bacterium]